MCVEICLSVCAIIGIWIMLSSVTTSVVCHVCVAGSDCAMAGTAAAAAVAIAYYAHNAK